MIKKITFKTKVLQYNITGSGMPVIFIHGFGEDSTIWHNQVSYLENFFTVLSIDLPGTGGSNMIDKEIIDISDLAEAIHEVVKFEKIIHFVMIGHSLGGYVSLEYQKKYPNELVGLGLFHSTANSDSEEKKTIRKKSISFIRKNGAISFLETTIPGLFHDFKESTAIDCIMKGIKQHRDIVLIQYYEAMMNRPSSIELLKSLTIPLLLVGGKYDEIIPLKETLRQSHLSRQTHFHILQHSAHMGMIEEIEESNTILRVFLEYLWSN